MQCQRKPVFFALLSGSIFGRMLKDTIKRMICQIYLDKSEREYLRVLLKDTIKQEKTKYALIYFSCDSPSERAAKGANCAARLYIGICG